MRHCPVCGRENPHEEAICHPRNGISVCVECCRVCEHHISIYMCGYHESDPDVELKAQIAAINREIIKKKGLIDWLYRNNKPKRADSETWTLKKLMAQSAELEKGLTKNRNKPDQ